MYVVLLQILAKWRWNTSRAPRPASNLPCPVRCHATLIAWPALWRASTSSGSMLRLLEFFLVRHRKVADGLPHFAPLPPHVLLGSHQGFPIEDRTGSLAYPGYISWLVPEEYAIFYPNWLKIAWHENFNYFCPILPSYACARDSQARWASCIFIDWSMHILWQLGERSPSLQRKSPPLSGEIPLNRKR